MTIFTNDRTSESEMAAKDQNSQFYDFYLKPNKERASVHDLPEKDMDSKIDNFHQNPDNNRAFGNELSAIKKFSPKNPISTELSEMN